MKRIALTVAGAVVLAMATWATVYKSEHQPQPQSQVQVEQALYIKLAAVYEGEFNGSPAAIVEKDILEKAAASFVDVPILMAHDYGNLSACIGRTTGARVAYDQGRQQYYLEVDAKIVDPAAAFKIKNGLYYSVSIGFRCEELTCSLDGMDTKECRHHPGEFYKIDGVYKMARAKFKKMVGLEISFVNVPGSRNARVLNFSNDPSSLSTSK